MKRNLNNSSAKEMIKDINTMMHGNPKAISFVYEFLWEYTDQDEQRGELPVVPDGTYRVNIKEMRIKETKDKLMFAVSCKIKEGEHKGRLLFFNRVISGNSSPKWTDGQAIKSVCTWLEHLETETIPEFVNYGDFADCILDIFQEVQGKVELEVDWAAKKFNPITIKNVRRK